MWRQKMDLLSQALIPRDPTSLGPITTFGLHGILQRVPLAALPLPSPEGTPQDLRPRWFGEVSVAVLQSAGVPASPLAGYDEERAPLFLIDPTNTLADLAGNLNFFRNLFPDADIRHGEDADSQAMHEQLPRASWLHVDAHGTFNPTFPELTGIELADGSFSMLEVENLQIALQLANLSTCHSGRGPTTADSGRYGMAGMVARAGAEWVVASRGKLEDRLAQDFNRVFYTAIGEGKGVPKAFAEGLAGVRDRYAPSQWSMLFLIRGREVGKKK